MKKFKLALIYLLFITIIAFSGCQKPTKQSVVPTQTQQRAINKTEAVEIAEKFIADQKKDPIGEVFPNATGVKFINNRWFIGFTYLSHFQEEDQFLEHMTNNGGVLTGYFRNGQLVKIVAEIGLSSCTRIYESTYITRSLSLFMDKKKIFLMSKA